MLQGAVALGGVTEPNGLALGSTIRGNATKQIDAVIARSLDSASMRTKLRPQVFQERDAAASKRPNFHRIGRARPPDAPNEMLLSLRWSP